MQPVTNDILTRIKDACEEVRSIRAYIDRSEFARQLSHRVYFSAADRALLNRGFAFGADGASPLMRQLGHACALYYVDGVRL